MADAISMLVMAYNAHMVIYSRIIPVIKTSRISRVQVVAISQEHRLTGDGTSVYFQSCISV